MSFTLTVRLLGKSFGDFRADASRNKPLPEFPPTPFIHILPERLHCIFAPRAAFSNRIASLLDDHEPRPTRILHSREVADGGMVIGPDRPIAFFNADCPIVCLWHHERFVVLHAGYRCLIRERATESNIIREALVNFPPGQTKAWIGFGIGPCCWVPGYATKPEILDPSRSHEADLLGRCLSRTTRSPFGPGYISVDLYLIAYELLIREGVRPESISWDTRCTCCAMESGTPLYWSHTRARKEGSPNGRNCAIAWLEAEAS